MDAGPHLTLASWLLSAAPIVLLTMAILWWKWSAPRAGAAAWLVALAIALWAFGGEAVTMAIASAKGLSLSLFVLTIIWASVYLFNVADRSGSIEAIGRSITRLARDPLTQALLVGWCFSGFIQGITGFGVPVAVATPLLMMMGFPLLRAAAIVLVGHGWAVTFGSLGSSYYTIQLVTSIHPSVLAPHMALLFAVPVVATGFVVAHLEGGMSAVRRSAPLVLVVGSAMAMAMWLLTATGAPQIASTVAGLAGVAGIGLLSRLPLLSGQPALTQPATGGAAPAPQQPSERGMGFHLGFLPYYCLIVLSVASQIGPIQEATRGLAWGLDYPGFVTREGFQVLPADAYARIRLLNHPAPLLLASLLITVGVYMAAKRWRSGTGWTALRHTYSQSIASTIGIATMVMMALVMADTGATTLLAQGIAQASGAAFPLVSPYIGVLGAFMTGSNTNSNVMFGVLQVEAANTLGIGAVTIASVQSIGGSIGSTLAPAKVLVASTLTGLSGREGEILRLVIPYVLGLVLLAGLEAMVLSHLLTSWAR